MRLHFGAGALESPAGLYSRVVLFSLGYNQHAHMNLTADASFGPQLEGRFDFTLLFEQTILAIGPSVLFLALSSVRVAVLVQREGVPGAWTSTVLWAKLVSPLCC